MGMSLTVNYLGAGAELAGIFGGMQRERAQALIVVVCEHECGGVWDVAGGNEALALVRLGLHENEGFAVGSVGVYDIVAFMFVFGAA